MIGVLYRLKKYQVRQVGKKVGGCSTVAGGHACLLVARLALESSIGGGAAPAPPPLPQDALFFQMRSPSHLPALALANPKYLLYKHCLLHGLNISLALDGGRAQAVGGAALGDRPYFRFYWITLNASYVMEFFLQTLVRRRRLRQRDMLRMQQTLMAVATVAALRVLRGVRVAPAALSLVLQFMRRHRELSNTMLVFIFAAAAPPATLIPW